MKALLLILNLCFFTLSAQILEKDIVDGFKLGKTEFLTYHMMDEIELITPYEEGIYSRDKCDKLIFNFFQKHKPKTFELVHRGKSHSGSGYHIGELSTQDNNYMVYILITSGKEDKISEIRIELDD